MVRLVQSMLADGVESPQDAALLQLSQLLSRLEQNVLRPSTEREQQLRTSEYERARNVEYARTLLVALEQDVAAMKAPNRRSEMQDALQAAREIVDNLLDRLADLRHMAVDDDESSGDEKLPTDDEVVPTPSTSAADTLEEGDGEEAVLSVSPPPASVPPAVNDDDDDDDDDDNLISPSSPPPPTQTTASVRARWSHSSARAALFAGRSKPATPQTSTATAEAMLDRQRAEQDALSDSMLRMAGALRASSQRISSTLEADKEVLGRAGEGMNRTERGMEAARGRMGTLKRMTEGQGWWGRMMLYAWVYGLMVVLVLLVFVMPKLRF
ncbi:hypothetical protein L249_2986 [Ophiocordyceps polyrhachis-furcata BCC 54312]|uniref:Synaptobrevin n=1 Tax=Ophiocordyceps polyrhachis-furcata BCC 54312 TaxID=1330021 RepID=A0A367LR89_9HYPO|nr:hypothetical protein L249_2986 [Ophiocordyceps polyrhachis-furcata BCC 54312]